ncbi:MAG: hypothetical protein G8D58_08015 [gamma proteobacterium symbiont of Phacoides pectinatus]
MAHHYRRDHPLNMWFVIAADDHPELERTIARIEETCGSAGVRLSQTQGVLPRSLVRDR